ncbi:DUF5994 family protein [Streptomyces sp. NPDC007189]|uniref:DUF5994 family protein n=1 Tax=Streptomyces sp. NPDC007189 TaxID=3154315 RepID=UPI0034534A77
MELSGTPAESAPMMDARTYHMPRPRLALAPDAGHGSLDGAWWPRCDALELELPALVDALEPAPGAVVRVVVDLSAWPDAPHAVIAPGRVIAVEPAGPGSGAHVITLDWGSVGRWVLLVLPPGEPAGTTGRLFAAAGPGNPLTASRLSALAALAESGRLRETAEQAE